MLLKFFLILTIAFASGKKCPGNCINLSTCKSQGGKVVGYCTNELPCCDLSVHKTGSCGEKKSGLQTAIFQSPDYPDYSSGDLDCAFHFGISDTPYDGIMVEFIDVETEGLGFAEHSSCQIDMIFYQGFDHWQSPARCGNLTGYVAVIDKSINVGSMKTLTILSLMTSSRYKWKIKISLLSTGMKDMTLSKNSTAKNIKHPSPDIRPASNIMDSIQNDTGNETEGGFEVPLVVNGEDTSIAEVPWQASLRLIFPYSLKPAKANDSGKSTPENGPCSNEGNHFCGGSIISDQHILTASHCFHPLSKVVDWKPVDFVRVFVGETDLCFDDKIKYGRQSQNYSISKIIFHHAYDDINVCYNDVVVLKLKEKINFNEYIRAIALSKRNRTYENTKVKVSGWGLTNLTIPLKMRQLPNLLQSTDGIYVENRTVCDTHLQRAFIAPKILVELYPKYRKVFSSVLCTSSKNNSVFKLVGQGDSGGPLIMFDEEGEDKIPIQIGIVSYGLPVLEAKHEHDNTFVDFFQDVSYYRDWIDLAMLV